jgi:hypothetical protein
MSILLSAYYPQGIVFAADKNATIIPNYPPGARPYVEGGATKVLSWPHHEAVLGYVGLGSLSGLPLDEWMRIFIAARRDFDDITRVAHELRDEIQDDFDKNFSPEADISKQGLIIHFGGFKKLDGVLVPVMYFIRNIPGITNGEYLNAQREFTIAERIEDSFKEWPNPSDYPKRVRQRLEKMENEGWFWWFNNGYQFAAFNVFREALWAALLIVQKQGYLPEGQSLDQRIAYCKMAVQLFGSFFEHHFRPEYRVVGGGVDVGYVPWPE